MSVRDRIDSHAEGFTDSEKKLCAVLLADYPFAGLQPISALSENACVSAPSISRFVNKIGFQGFQDFQRHLIAELKEGQRSPVDLRHTRRPAEGDFLADFIGRAREELAETASVITEAQFKHICALLADPKRRIFVIGGRISDALAQYLLLHLRQIRPDVFALPSDPEAWPNDLLRMRSRDVLLVFDFRRYQTSLATLAQRAAARRGAHVVLMTDKWVSPIARSARDVVALPIEIGTEWDSYVSAFTLIEAILAFISDDQWDRTSVRLREWDALRAEEGEA